MMCYTKWVFTPGPYPFLPVSVYTDTQQWHYRMGLN